MIDQEVVIPLGGALGLPGHCTVPQGAKGLVVFVHGSGSSRLSPRNQFVAHFLNARGIGTLLFDLLTDAEALDRRNVFDIELLARRVANARAWIASQPEVNSLPLGLFGASTGAAAALVSAAVEPDGIAAVVSRGGRPDLAGPWLAAVTAPTLLIVGSLDHPVLEWNAQAAARLTCEHAVEVVPGATHLFEEPGTLEGAAHRASAWFSGHFLPKAKPRPIE